MSASSLKKIRISKSWRRFIGSSILIYAFFAFFVYFRADSLIFFPQPSSYNNTENILQIPVTATENISALYLPNPQANYTLLYIHGNAEDLGDIRPKLKRLQTWGFNVFAYDYRGYGTSDGHPSEKNAYQDADAAYRYLTQQLNIPPAEIILYGRSVGGGSATELAQRYSTAGLILESTFTSAFRVIAPVPLLPFDKFTNLDKLKKVTSPVLIMHGQADQIIPIKHGKALYEAAPEPKMSLWVPEASHNNFSLVAGDRHRQALLAFQNLLEKH